jgi:hypothetical protein
VSDRRYFVSYTATVNGRTRFGNTDVFFNRPVTDGEDVDDLARACARDAPWDVDDLTVLYWRASRIETTDPASGTSRQRPTGDGSTGAGCG